jgi:hypothetical protein
MPLLVLSTGLVFHSWYSNSVMCRHYARHQPGLVPWPHRKSHAVCVKCACAAEWSCLGLLAFPQHRRRRAAATAALVVLCSCLRVHLGTAMAPGLHS